MARRWSAGRLLILCYHGFELVDESEFRSSMFMSKGCFRQRLKLLSKFGIEVLELSEALSRLYDSDLPPNAVVITVDDGFFSTYEVAYPVLREFNAPATVYVTTYYVMNQEPVFRLVVQYMFWKSANRRLQIRGVNWTSDQLVDLDDSEARRLIAKQCFTYGELSCTSAQRSDLISELAEMLGVDYSQIEASRILSLMSVAEIREISEGGIDVQLHTHRHQFPVEDETLAKSEVSENRRLLTEITGTEPSHFCYPSGIWNEHQSRWLEDLGVQSATTCDIGFNDASTHKYKLKRFVDGEHVSEVEFLAEISGFSDLLRRMRGR